MIPVLDIGAQLLGVVLTAIGQKVPAEVTAAVQAAIDAVEAHKNDLITKANLEAQRG